MNEFEFPVVRWDFSVLEKAFQEVYDDQGEEPAITQAYVARDLQAFFSAGPAGRRWAAVFALRAQENPEASRTLVHCLPDLPAVALHHALHTLAGPLPAPLSDNTTRRLENTLLIGQFAAVIALGCLWVVASVRLLGEQLGPSRLEWLARIEDTIGLNLRVAAGSLFAYVVLFGLFLAVTVAGLEPQKPLQPVQLLVVSAIGILLAAPAVWALMRILRWAWDTPMF